MACPPSHERHEEQTKADRERRITETFGKAVEQLGSEKLATRLGGIYTLERLASESKREYWPIEGAKNLTQEQINSAFGNTQEQINSAFGNENTTLPEGLKRPSHWSDPQSRAAVSDTR